VGGEEAGADLKERLWRRVREELPWYMVPGEIEEVGELPQTTSGKIDRRALELRSLESKPISSDYQAPTGEVEAKITQIFEQLLGKQGIGIKDNFFELGGYSLKAVELSYEIERQTGKKVPVSMIFNLQTIEKLANFVERENSESSNGILHKLTKNAENPALILVHPATGSVWSYIELAERLEERYAVYAIQSKNLIQENTAESARIEEMAAQYITELEGFDGNPALNISGWSLGGLIAFEMVRQLEKSGRGIEKLIMIDTMPPRSVIISRWKKLVSGWNEEEVLFLNFAREVGLSQEEIERLVEDKRKSKNLNLPDHAFNLAKNSDLPVFMKDLSFLHKLWATYKINALAQRFYKPERIKADILYIKAGEAGSGTEKKWKNYWKKMTSGNFTSFVSNASHHTILREPSLSEVAKIFYK
ncbi:hypothetical protein H6S82_02145, partial [Planktothrix sp. FACHB-1355]|uniref:thioesterase domain-containing protein n=1 Tax=Planktothrix sp. FACHB-1355 TaxID=2692854 RepID=UPI00198D5A58